MKTPAEAGVFIWVYTLGMEYSPGRHQHFKSERVEEMPVEHAPLPVWHNDVQLKLAMSAFPEAPKPILPWLEEDETGHSLAERFRAYVEAPTHHEETIDLNDETRLEKLLDEVKHQTLH